MLWAKFAFRSIQADADVGKNSPFCVTPCEKKGVEADDLFDQHLAFLMRVRETAKNDFRMQNYGVDAWLSQRRPHALGIPRIFFKVGRESLYDVDEAALSRWSIPASPALLAAVRGLVAVDNAIGSVTACAVQAAKDAQRVCDACLKFANLWGYAPEDVETLTRLASEASEMDQKPQPYAARATAIDAISCTVRRFRRGVYAYLRDHILASAPRMLIRFLILYLDDASMPPRPQWAVLTRDYGRHYSTWTKRTPTGLLLTTEAPQRLTRALLMSLDLQDHAAFYLKADSQLAQIHRIFDAGRALFELDQNDLLRPSEDSQKDRERRAQPTVSVKGKRKRLVKPRRA